MKTMSVEKNGYLNGLVSLSKQHKFIQTATAKFTKKIHSQGTCTIQKLTKKETPIKIVTVEKKGYPNNVNTHSNGKLNKEKLQRRDSHNPKTHNGLLLQKTNIHQTHFHNPKIYSNEYLQKRIIQKKDFMNGQITNKGFP